MDVPDARFDRRSELCVGIAVAAVHHPFGRESVRERSAQLPAGINVGSGSHLGERSQHGEVPVRLHRKSDPVRYRRQRRIEPGVALADHRQVVHVGGRAYLIGDLAQPHLTVMEGLPAPGQTRIVEQRARRARVLRRATAHR